VGESKEVGQYANRLDLPIAIVDKRRYGDDENLRATNLIGDVKGKVALIIDDEVAGGGTLMEATRFVLERGAVAVEASTVHPVLSGRAIERIEASPLRQLVVTDTIPLPARKRIDKIHVQSARLFADAIHAIPSPCAFSSQKSSISSSNAGRATGLEPVFRRRPSGHRQDAGGGGIATTRQNIGRRTLPTRRARRVRPLARD